MKIISRLPKWMVCKASLAYHFSDKGGIYWRYGWRILGVFVEDGRRKWKDTQNKQEVIMHTRYWL